MSKYKKSKPIGDYPNERLLPQDISAYNLQEDTLIIDKGEFEHEVRINAVSGIGNESRRTKMRPIGNMSVSSIWNAASMNYLSSIGQSNSLVKLNNMLTLHKQKNPEQPTNKVYYDRKDPFYYF